MLARDDFVFLVARDGGEVAGFAYGYTGEYGRWWTEHVAAALPRPSSAPGWLDRPHYEIVELHVRPTLQRRGLGSALLAQLLTRQPHDRARADDASRLPQGADVLCQERLGGARPASTSAPGTHRTSRWRSHCEPTPDRPAMAPRDVARRQTKVT